MLYRTRALVALLALATVAACDDDDDDDIVGPGVNRAFVRFVNATNGGIDVRNDGTLTGGYTNVGFGAQVSCLTVNTTGATGTGLQFFPANGSTPLTFTQNLQSGGEYTIIAYPGTVAGTTQFVTLDNTGFTPGANQSGVRLFHGVPGAGSVVLRQGGTAVGTGAAVGYGNASSYSGVTYGANQTFTITSGSTTVATASNVNLAAGENYTFIAGVPTTGSADLRTILTSGC